MWPEPLTSLFARGAGRLRRLAILRACAIALGVALPVLLARLADVASTRLAVVIGVAAAVAGAAWAWWRTRVDPVTVATVIERRTAIARNLLVTAAEIGACATPLRDDVRAVVFRDAADAAAGVDVARLLPAGRTAAAAAVLVAVWTGGLLVDRAWLVRAREVAVAALPGGAAVSRLTVTITPPSYTGRAPVVADDPSALEVFEGSALAVEVGGRAHEIDVALAGDRHRMAAAGPGRFRATLDRVSDGALSVQAFGPDGDPAPRRVVVVRVVPDRAPSVRITAPGQDTYLKAASAPLAVAIEAADDVGLRDLRLVYTKVSGSGESFTFASGRVPVAITRASAQAWTATASLALPSMALEPGDLVVYHALVEDARPGRAAVESDAFIVEILQPGLALAEGFTIDDDREKYALSQQMVIVKTERLLAKKSTVDAATFTDEARTIAAEQRKVRAEFVFMMGGEFEDATAGTGDLNEEEEAANESEIAAGRLQNNGRRDVILATRYMGEAAQLLDTGDLSVALPREKLALAALQRAFTKSRYILRVLTPRERIEESRRLSGALTDAADWRRSVPAATDDPRARALAVALGRLHEVAQSGWTGREARDTISAVAESLLAIDPSLAPAARDLEDVARALTSGQSPAAIASTLDAATAALTAAAARWWPASASPVDPSRARLRGAVADGLGGRGGRGRR